MRTSELVGTALDWAVAKCEGEPVYSYSTNWVFGGPIIEREKLCLCWEPRLKEMEWEAGMYGGQGTGPTPLIAAMRCYVASKLGDDVEVPDAAQPQTK